MTEKSVKTCTKSGQWSAKDGLEWTDYTPCLNKQVYRCHYLLIWTLIIVIYVLLLALRYVSCSFVQTVVAITMYIGFYGVMSCGKTD